MTRRLWKASTSLALILLVAFGARLAFAWDQERKIPDTALAMAPFAHTLRFATGIPSIPSFFC